MKKLDSSYVKERYNRDVTNYEGEYEHWRWESTSLGRRDYGQTYKTLLYHLKDYHFENLLEIGCGTGTWTKVLCDKAKYTTVIDISEAMINIAKRALSQREIKYIIGDFQNPNLVIPGKYDAIFSIRAIEYMSNKSFVINRMYDLLNNNGKVFLITKNPYIQWRWYIPLVSRLHTGSDPLHSCWVRHKKLMRLMQKSGFGNIKVYPAIIDIPLPRKMGIKVSEKMWELLFNKSVNKLYLPIIESYLIVGEKLGNILP